MNTYSDYINEIEERKVQGLHPKPIDSAELLSEIITQIKVLVCRFMLYKFLLLQLMADIQAVRKTGKQKDRNIFRKYSFIYIFTFSTI